MGIEDGTTEFTLIRPIEYRLNGSAESTSNVLLREPCMDHVKHYLALKQMIMRAQFDLAQRADEINKMRDNIGEEVKPFGQNVADLEAQAEENANLIAIALQASGAVDIGDFIGTFETMACMKARKPICLVDGRQAMTGALWAMLYPDDAFHMAVRWCSFFAMPSAEGLRTTSGPQSDSATGRTVA